MQLNLEAIMLLGPPPARAAASLPGQGLLISAQAAEAWAVLFSLDLAPIMLWIKGLVELKYILLFKSKIHTFW